MFKFVVLLVFLFAVEVFCQAEDYADSEPINNENAVSSPKKSCDFPCPQGWTYFPAQGYCLFPTPELPWNSAEHFCVTHGGHLMSIHGRISFVNAHVMLWDDVSIWTGLNRDNSENEWRHLNNATVNYYRGLTRESFKCVRIYGDTLYENQSCETKNFGICQKYASA